MTAKKATTKKIAKSSQKATKSTVQSTGVAKIPQPHGGALNAGGTPGNPGGGRPKDAVRAAYLELGATKGHAVVSAVLDGKVRISLVGQCPKCKYIGEMPDGESIAILIDRVRATVDQQLKANDQALKYGLGTKDETTLTVVGDEQAQQFAAIVYNAVEEEGAQVLARVVKRVQTSYVPT